MTALHINVLPISSQVTTWNAWNGSPTLTWVQSFHLGLGQVIDRDRVIQYAMTLEMCTTYQKWEGEASLLIGAVYEENALVFRGWLLLSVAFRFTLHQQTMAFIWLQANTPLPYVSVSCHGPPYTAPRLLPQIHTQQAGALSDITRAFQTRYTCYMSPFRANGDLLSSYSINIHNYTNKAELLGTSRAQIAHEYQLVGRSLRVHTGKIYNIKWLQMQ